MVGRCSIEWLVILDIVKNGKNRTLNTSMNNLKFFKFKLRLLFKAIERGKKVFEVKEQYTAKFAYKYDSQKGFFVSKNIIVL